MREVHSIPSATGSDLLPWQNLASVDAEVAKAVFQNEPESNQNEKFLNSIDKTKTKNKKQVKLEINRPAIKDPDNEDIIFQRVLGHFEIPFAHRWVETTAAQCHICQKLTYTVFTWNKRIAEELSSRKQHRMGC